MFKNLHELLLKMPTEKDCRDYLIQQRWDGCPVCPYCGFDGKTYVIENGKRFKCGSKECGKKYSVTVGTIFESSQIPLTKWLNACYVVTAHKKGISSHQLGRDLGVTQRSAWFMIHRIREMMMNVTDSKLDGVVEVDEVYLGGKNNFKHKKQRDEINKKGTGYSNKVGVVGMLQRGTEVRLKVIGLTNQGVYIKPIIRDNIATTANIVTDGFGAYKDLRFEFSDHQIVNHTQDEFVRGEWHTNGIEGFFSQLRRGIYGIYHWCSPVHLQSYCNEFAFRYNTRKMKDCDRFQLSLNNMERRLTWQRLTKKD